MYRNNQRAIRESYDGRMPQRRTGQQQQDYLRVVQRKKLQEEKIMAQRKRRLLEEKKARRKRRILVRRIKTAVLMIIMFLTGFLAGGIRVKSTNNEVQTAGDIVQAADAGISEDSWNMVLVNKWNPVEEGYTPDLIQVEDGYYVDSHIADSLQSMLNSASKEGVTIYITSAYRSYERQTELYENKTDYYLEQGYSTEKAKEEAGKVVAVPGTSEHQLGLAVDLVSAEYTGLDEKQEETTGYRWLVKHCAEYGFILRYPNGKTDITGIIYEPWHFRYVGVEAAREIMEQGVCLEEYLNNKNGI